MTPDEMAEILRSVTPLHIRTVDLHDAATMLEEISKLQEDCRKWQKMAEDLIQLQGISQRREERESRLDEPTCNQHPDAPHGFCRQASHGAGRYVCECEGWKPDAPEAYDISEEEMAQAIDDTEMCLPSISDEEKDFLLRAIEPSPYKELAQDIERCRPDSLGKALEHHFTEFDSAIEGAQTYEALVKDAERYRWIARDNRERELRIPAGENKNSIDAAIDAAMEKP